MGVSRKYDCCTKRELIDRKIKDVKSVARHVKFAVCCVWTMERHDFVVEVWVEEAIS